MDDDNNVGYVCRTCQCSIKRWSTGDVHKNSDYWSWDRRAETDPRPAGLCHSNLERIPCIGRLRRPAQGINQIASTIQWLASNHPKPRLEETAEPGKINTLEHEGALTHMPDEKQAFKTVRFMRVESAFNNGSIEEATAEIKLDTYKQIQNCFLGLCMFFGLVVLAMQHSDLHKEQALVRQTLLHSPTDFASVERRYKNNRDYKKLLELYNSHLAESERKFGLDSPELIPELGRLASTYMRLGNHAESEKLYERSREIERKARARSERHQSY